MELGGSLKPRNLGTAPNLNGLSIIGLQGEHWLHKSLMIVFVDASHEIINYAPQESESRKKQNEQDHTSERSLLEKCGKDQ